MWADPLMALLDDRSKRPLPPHPYRDAALVYGIMALLLVVIAWVTGGDPLRAVVVAVAFFVVATAWTSWRFRVRIRERDAATSASAGKDETDPANENGRGSAGR
jgi:membrane protein implicated in regulation of membrane protease activity